MIYIEGSSIKRYVITLIHVISLSNLNVIINLIL